MAQRELIHPAAKPRSPPGQFSTHKSGAMVGWNITLLPTSLVFKHGGIVLSDARFSNVLHYLCVLAQVFWMAKLR
jgi:hypothetical protein